MICLPGVERPHDVARAHSTSRREESGAQNIGRWDPRILGPRRRARSTASRDMPRPSRGASGVPMPHAFRPLSFVRVDLCGYFYPGCCLKRVWSQRPMPFGRSPLSGQSYEGTCTLGSGSERMPGGPATTRPYLPAFGRASRGDIRRKRARRTAPSLLRGGTFRGSLSAASAPRACLGFVGIFPGIHAREGTT